MTWAREYFVRLLDHLYDKQDARERYIPHIADTLLDPYEIWITEYRSDSGAIEFRKHYIGLFRTDKDQKKDHFVVVWPLKDGTLFWNAFLGSEGRSIKLASE